MFKHYCHLKPNITRKEVGALKELRKDRVVLTMEKGVAMVVLDKQDKAQDFLVQRVTYRSLMADPTNKQYKFFNMLIPLRQKEDWGDTTYKRLSNWYRPPEFYGLLKFYKKHTPIGPYSPVWLQLHMGWPRSWPASLGHW